MGKDANEIEVQFLPLDDLDLTDQQHGGHHGHPAHHGRHPSGHGALPLSHFMQMFPLDIPGSGAHVKVIHIDPNTPEDQIPDIISDHILNSILSEMSGGFHSRVKPLMAATHSAARDHAPHACMKDIEKLCHDDHGHDHEHLSTLHCLGLHVDEISDLCSKQITHSIPVVCAHEISRFCHKPNDIDKSTLQCLEDMHGHLQNESCSQSVIATRAILSRMKTQNVALVNRRTGEIIRSTVNVVSTSFYVTIYAVLIVGLAVLLYSLWMRDDETSFLKSFQKTLRELKVTTSKKPQTMEMKSNYSL